MLAQAKEVVARREAATRLGISERAIRRYLRAKRIRGTVGGIVAADIEAGLLASAPDYVNSDRIEQGT
jgi:hypothetical protein